MSGTYHVAAGVRRDHGGMNRTVMHLRSLAVVVTIAVVAGACGASPQTSAPTAVAGERQSGMQNTEIEQFDAFPLFWLGDEFEGLPLNFVRDERRPDRVPGIKMHSVTMVYGDCRPQGSASSCPAPLQITVHGFCGPTLAAGVARPDASLRDAAVAGADRGHLSLTFATGKVMVISSIGDDPDAQARRIAMQIRGANQLARDVGPGESFTLARPGTEQPPDGGCDAE